MAWIKTKKNGGIYSDKLGGEENLFEENPIKPFYRRPGGLTKMKCLNIIIGRGDGRGVQGPSSEGGYIFGNLPPFVCFRYERKGKEGTV